MGELLRDGESRPVSQNDLAFDERARSLQALQQVPVLQHADNPHEYLFFALFDGTGQDVRDPAQLPTNVGVLKKQLDQLKDDPGNRVGGQYIEGIGTQDNPAERWRDQLLPFTWDDRIERAYQALAEQTRRWQQHDPEARIRVAEVGYSRGAVLAPGLARLVDRYGIADPEGLTFGRDAHGRITVESDRPRLALPGQTAQAMGLFDPVATNMPDSYDARLPPSVISAVALAAMHERREAFPHQTILEPGLSPDRRFATLPSPGGHSNVGGGNSDHGLEAMAFNRMADYLNGLRDRPLFEYRPLPDDPALYTVYQARGPTAVPGLDDDSLRDLRPELADCKIVDPCRSAEPMSQALAAQFEYRRLQPSAPTPAFAGLAQQATGNRQPLDQNPRTPSPPSDPAHPDHGMLEQIRRGVHDIDRNLGKPHDEASERLSRSLLAASKDNRGLSPGHADVSLAANALQRVDHVVMGTDGRYVFAVQGGLHDPAHRRAAVDVSLAIRTPIEESDARLDSANRQIEQERQLVQRQELQRESPIHQNEPARSAPVLH